MEKTAAACAMEWSIELEKSLRSKRPGKAIEAIREIGQRLIRWDRELSSSKQRITMAEQKLFDLIPEEDRLYLNVIFMRLADTFQFGDKQIKRRIVEMFLTIVKDRRKRRTSDGNAQKEGSGILSNRMLGNYKELLRRVKVVFDNGDVEERALALVLFGCWASFACGSADIRYVILSSLVSSDMPEVNASLFSAGCFCEFANDFAFVFLEILVNMLMSCEASKSVRLAGGRAFANVWRPFSVADRAYKTGLKLLRDTPDEDLLRVMLISLSKISSKWTLLIPEQIELLLSYVDKEYSLHFKIAAWRCLSTILGKAFCQLPSAEEKIQDMVDILNDSKLSSTLQYEVLKSLHKVVLYNLTTIPCAEMLRISSKLITCLENMLQSFNISRRLIAIRIMIDIFDKVLEGAEALSDGSSSPLLPRVISLIINQILLLTESTFHHQPDICVLQVIKSMLRLLLDLIEKHPDLGGLLLHNICIFIENWVKLFDMDVEMIETDSPEHGIRPVCPEHESLVSSKIMFYVCKVMVTCFGQVEATETITSQVLTALRLLVKTVCKHSLTHHLFPVYYLLLHKYIADNCTWHSIEEIVIPGENVGLSRDDSFCQHEILTLYCAKKMLERKDKWSLYRAGKHAACQGAWFTAAFIFEQLSTSVQSDYCYQWLKSLAQLSHAESQVQSFLLTKQGLNRLKISKFLVTPERNNVETGESDAWKMKFCSNLENFVGACQILRSSVEMLDAPDIGHKFSYQKWFLTLRAKVLETLVGLMKTLRTTLVTPYNSSSSGQVANNVLHANLMIHESFSSLMYHLTHMSSRLEKLTREYDLLAASYIGIDCRSALVSSALSLSCSLLAFSTGFAFSIPYLHSPESFKVYGFENLEQPFYARLLQDLATRLWSIDCESSSKLWKLLRLFQMPNVSLYQQLRNRRPGICYEAREILKICRYAIQGIDSLQGGGSREHDENSTLQIFNNSLQLLLDVITKWMQIPLWIPNHFFQVRPCLSAKIYAVNEDGRSVNGLYITSGFHLSLNLCLQLRNIPPNMKNCLTKLYCILYCGASCRTAPPTEEIEVQTDKVGQDGEIDDILELHEKLLCYMAGRGSVHSKYGATPASMDEYLCFEPNERGQGFTTCLLDVSTFPVGSYRIKWLCCFLDSDGFCWVILPLNAGPVFCVKPSIAR